MRGDGGCCVRTCDGLNLLGGIVSIAYRCRAFLVLRWEKHVSVRLQPAFMFLKACRSNLMGHHAGLRVKDLLDMSGFMCMVG